MEFLLGVYSLSADLRTWKSHVGREYVEENATHQTVQSVDLTGNVVPDGDLGAQLLIDGKRPLGGLPIGITIRRGTPDEFGDMSTKQTKHLDKDMQLSFIKHAVGYCHYSKASSDKETGRTFEEGLFADIVVDEWLMSDLWYAVRTPGITLPRFHMTLFGDQLLQVQDFIRITYHWNQNPHASYWPLYIASFHYSTENRAPR
jgi:hypothetical protein